MGLLGGPEAILVLPTWKSGVYGLRSVPQDELAWSVAIHTSEPPAKKFGNRVLVNGGWVENKICDVMFLTCNKCVSEVGEMVQWLGTQAVLPENPGMVPSTHMMTCSSLRPQFQSIRSPLLASMDTRHTCDTRKCRQNTHAHKLKLTKYTKIF